tara:strand:- start:5370 stop:6203 length:834 start_codon:yes stop_codon:yes gene_type:complete
MKTVEHNPVNILRATYFENKAVNQSLLKQVLKSPLHAWHYMNTPNEPTPAMALGTAIHTKLLEYDLFEEKIAVLPEINRRTKEGKEQYNRFVASAKGKTIITQEQNKRCDAAFAMVCKNDKFCNILDDVNYEHELALGWEDKKHKMNCKACLDLINFETKEIIDLKTTSDASYSGFSRSSANFMYHLQAAFYLRAATGLSGVEAMKDGWTYKIMAVESVQPHGCAMFEFDKNAIAEGDRLVERAMTAWANALVWSEFDGYTQETQKLSLPVWAISEE